MAGLFPLGQVVATPGIMELPGDPIRITRCLYRHMTGDWGDLCEEDRQQNEFALQNEGRLFSAYKFVDGTKIWIITEYDRSVTTILLPEEY